jgi:succinylglutamate desuccinylase
MTCAMAATATSGGDGETSVPPHAMALPSLSVRLPIPDLGAWQAGSQGIPGVWSFCAPVRGPHVAVVALIHGNEIAGALLLDRLLRQELRPLRGRLTLVFANLAAFARFDPADPTGSRFLDEDLNRIWDPALLDGPRRSRELRRARELRPVFETVDVLLDLHSMLWPSDPLMLTGISPESRRLAVTLGEPPLVVLDEGHAAGLRLIDYPRFAAEGRAAILLEAGPHWEEPTIQLMEACTMRLLRRLGLLLPTLSSPPPGRLARVTRTVTAATHGFTFLRDFRGGEVVARRNTLIALDGEVEIRTPHDDCLLVMPSPRVLRGHTAVRMARFVD